MRVKNISKGQKKDTNLMVYLTVTWTKIQFVHTKNNKTFALLIRTKGLSDRSNSGKENLQSDMCMLY